VDDNQLYSKKIMPSFAAMIVHQGGKFESRWILSPNASLTPAQARGLLGLMAVGMALIGGGFTWVGAWPVLPFCGLELWLLGYGLNWSLRQNATREVVTIDSAKVRVEQIKVKSRHCHEFKRAWAQLDWSELGQAKNPRLYLGSHGRRVEIGAFLAAEEKRALARLLRQALES
jgi:uncharacterized membrane protein